MSTPAPKTKPIDLLRTLNLDQTKAVMRILSDAVLAERERCAAAVRAIEEVEDPLGDLSADWHSGWGAAIESAVAAIRSGK